MSVESTMITQSFDTEAAIVPQPVAGRVEQISRATQREMTRAIYTSCYCTSYALTFPVVFLAHLIPGGAPLIGGISDGARAALDYVRATKAAREHTNAYDNCI